MRHRRSLLCPPCREQGLQALSTAQALPRHRHCPSPGCPTRGHGHQCQRCRWDMTGGLCNRTDTQLPSCWARNLDLASHLPKPGLSTALAVTASGLSTQQERQKFRGKKKECGKIPWNSQLPKSLHCSLTCNNLPDWVGAHRACEGARATTAAPLPVFAALQTGRAWPAAGGLLTWEVEWHQADPEGREYLGDRHHFYTLVCFLFIPTSHHDHPKPPLDSPALRNAKPPKER